MLVAITVILVGRRCAIGAEGGTNAKTRQKGQVSMTY